VQHEEYLEFLFGGDIRQLLQALAALDVSDIWLEDPSLEDVFMHYYTEGGDRA